MEGEWGIPVVHFQGHLINTRIKLILQELDTSFVVLSKLTNLKEASGLAQVSPKHMVLLWNFDFNNFSQRGLLSQRRIFNTPILIVSKEVI